MSLPIISHLPRPTIPIHIGRIERLVESRRIPIIKRRRQQLETRRPLPRLATLELSVFGSLVAHRLLDVVDFVVVVGAAAGDCSAVAEAEAGFAVAVADGVVDVGAAEFAVEGAAGVFAVAFGDGDGVGGGGGSAVRWGSRDEEGKGGGDEDGGELHGGVWNRKFLGFCINGR